MKGDQPNNQEENYSLGDPIARGGMGSVMVAEDRKLNRQVALKVMTFDAFADEALRRRFVREAQVLARLAHPNIVPIYDIVWEDGIPQFYTMKLVQGRTLQALLDALRRGDPEISRVYTLDHLLTIFLKVCDAMAFAHSQGVVHRDLKPANVMIGEFGEVLVMDWGLAGMEGDELPIFQLEPKGDRGQTGADGGLGEVSLTMDGVVMGTPRFMSPEQAQGRVEEIDELSDLFSLGGILYAILTLRPPVDGDSVEEVLKKISGGTIVLPTETHAGRGDRKGVGKQITLSHCPGGQVPRRIASVAMKALSLDRQQRYPSVSAFVGDIVAFQKGFSTSAEKVGAFGQLVLLMKRHQVMTGALLAILLLSVAFMFKLMAAAKSERRAAESERRTAYSAVLAQALAAREHHDLGQARRLLGGIDPGLRGFEWRLLSSHCRGDEEHSFRLGIGGGATPQCFTVLPGSQRIAIISADGLLHLRDMEGRETIEPRELPALPKSAGKVRRYDGLSFSPNEKRLAYANGDLLQVLDAETLEVLYQKLSRLPQLGWLDDERLLCGFNGSAAAPPDSEPGAWIVDLRDSHVAGGKIRHSPIARMCAPLTVSADRRFFAVHRVDTRPSYWTRTLHVYRTDGDLEKAPEAIYSMPGRDYPGELVFSSTGQFLAFTAGSAIKQSVRVLEVSTARVLFDQEFEFPFHGLAFDPREQRLGLVGDDSVVRLYDFIRGVPEGPEIDTYDDEVDFSRCQPVDGRGAHAPPRDLITRSAQDGRAWFFLGHEKRVLDLAFDPRGALITAGGDGVLHRWPQRFARPAVRIGYLDTTYDLNRPAASANGRHVLYAIEQDVYGGDGRLVVRWHAPLAVLGDGRAVTQDRVTGDIVVWVRVGGAWQEQKRIEGSVPFWHDGKTQRAALSQDENRLAGTLAGRLFCVDFDDETISWSGDLGKAASAFSSHAISPDGEWIASSDFGSRVSIHRFGAPEKIVTWLDGGNRDDDTVMTFARDGRLLYTGNEDGRVRVWDTASWREIPELGWPAHLSGVSAIAVSHDHQLIATSGDDTLKLFSAEASPDQSPRREHLVFPIGQSANWIQFARDETGVDRALLHSVPGRTLEIWNANVAPNEFVSDPNFRPANRDPVEPDFLRHHGAVRLLDGTVLVAGGETHPSGRPCVALSDCRLYDPVSETWSRTGSLRSPRTRNLTLTLLENGKVLVAGGTARGGAPLARCELYDPESGMWTATGSMASPRSGGTRLLLPNGKVLAAGGVSDEGIGIAGVELYHVARGDWSLAGHAVEPRSNASWSIVSDREVLIVGGYDGSFRPLGCEVLDLQTGMWRSTGSPTVGRASGSASVTTLLTGDVLIVGGSTEEGITSRCELYDPVTETWRLTSPLPSPRSNHTATLLPDGKVLVVGGYLGNIDHVANQALVYDVETGKWSVAQGLTGSRVRHTVTLLDNGKVLVVGGRDAARKPQGVEIYEP